jgi:AcrR family transcriptional regulator
MPRISQERADATRDRLLRAARKVFVEKGFDEASTHDVAREAGVSVGTIYVYFQNKDELIWASIDTSNREETEALLAETRAVGSITERLDRSFRGWWEGSIDLPGGPAFLTEAWAAASRRPLIRDLMARRFERGVMFNAVLLREGVERGELPADLDVDALARTFAALLEGLVVEYVETGGSVRRVDAQKRFRLVMDALMAVARGQAAASTTDGS